MNEEMQANVAIRPVERVAQAAARAGEADLGVAEEQLAYARVLDAGVKIGFLLLVATFVPYSLGLLAPQVPVDDLPRYWSLSVRDYLAATGMHAGWGWIRMLEKGDVLNFLGIAFLSGVSVVCYAVVAPRFFRKKDAVYGWLAVAEVLVLVLAASGVLKAGH
ncbi:MAG TPA: hypothetical protein VLS93_19440 [Anaeromyxobacteraceae bacterium]|nr:hypothetical protein [Anaeromyxobacteraceae bacterium]